MTRWVGIEFSTENRSDDIRAVETFTQERHAVVWRERLGPRGEGRRFSPTNGHRLLRSVYRMPHGWRAKPSWSSVELAAKVSTAGEFVVPN
ncbi:MAG: hypothetical protein OES69_14590 [Myxococcales bacterium]|nr:hypothetical protein [Myxococcales bacterium]